MSATLVLYCLTATLLLVHEIESAYEEEWDILKLPGGITGFLILHVPIILLILYGTIELSQGTAAGKIIGLIVGLGGMLPLLVHGLLVRSPRHFNRMASRVVLFACAASGIVLLWMDVSTLP